LRSRFPAPWRRQYAPLISNIRWVKITGIKVTLMGKRHQPLLVAISTPTGNNSGIGKQLWNYAVRTMEGTQDDNRLFALIHTIDPEDDTWH
jgi:phage terminase large subunit-like protein